MATTKTDEGYKGKDGSQHRANTRKGEVHRIFDTKGRDEAIAYAIKHKLKKNTALVWTGTWARGSSKTSRKPAAKKAARKAKARTAARGRKAKAS